MTPRSVTFTVWGRPQQKGSARQIPIGGKAGAPMLITSDNKSLKAWEACVRAAAQQVAGDVFFMDAVALEVVFVFPRPKSVSERKRREMTTAPDLSKLVRGVEDAITKVLWTDDALVTRIVAAKTYGPPDRPGHAVITITDVRPVAAVEGRLDYATTEAEEGLLPTDPA